MPATSVKLVNIIPQSLSGETAADGKPYLAVNPANPAQIAVTTAFSLVSGDSGPVYKSFDGGDSWEVDRILPTNFLGDSHVWCDSAFGSDGRNYYATFGVEYLQVARTDSFASPAALTLLSGPDFDTGGAIVARTVATGLDAGQDRVYVAGIEETGLRSSPVSMDVFTDGKAPVPAGNISNVDSRAQVWPGPGITWPGYGDGLQIRTAVHSNGTVYAAFCGLRLIANPMQPTDSLIDGPEYLVVVRDDHWGTGGSTAFKDLTDPHDGGQGFLLAKNIGIQFGSSVFNGQELVGTVSVAVDPNNSNTVWVAWNDLPARGVVTLHVVRSTDGGATWSKDLLTLTGAINASLAITENGLIGLLCQEFLGNVAQWASTLRFTADGIWWSLLTLAQTGPALTPGIQTHMLAVGNSFYGVFAADNTPDASSFPQSKPKYQRNADWPAKQLHDVDNVTPVAASVDPFFFLVTPDPCQPLSDAAVMLQENIDSLSELIGSHDETQDPLTPAELIALRKLMSGFRKQLADVQGKLKVCRLANP